MNSGIHTKWAYSEVVDKALSSTLGRTINTSLTTLLVMLAIFTFGGDSIRGFMFALIIGVVVGTYSSLFVATPIMIGVATNSDEYVPTTTPIIKANINPLIESPPNVKMANITNNVVNDVLMVLPKVLLNALSTTSL